MHENPTLFKDVINHPKREDSSSNSKYLSTSRPKEDSQSQEFLSGTSKITLRKNKQESYSHDTLLPNPKQYLNKFKEDSHSLNLLPPKDMLSLQPNKEDIHLLDTMSRKNRETLLKLLTQYSNESILLRELVAHCLVEINNDNNKKCHEIQPQTSGMSTIKSGSNIQQSSSPPRTTLPRTKKNATIPANDSCDACMSTSRQQAPWLVDISKIIAENTKKK